MLKIKFLTQTLSYFLLTSKFSFWLLCSVEPLICSHVSTQRDSLSRVAPGCCKYTHPPFWHGSPTVSFSFLWTDPKKNSCMFSFSSPKPLPYVIYLGQGKSRAIQCISSDLSWLQPPLQLLPLAAVRVGLMPQCLYVTGQLCSSHPACFLISQRPIVCKITHFSVDSTQRGHVSLKPMLVKKKKHLS